MKIGIISDIHGNLPSLKAVLHAFEERNVDTIVCLGDMIGYFHQSLEVLELVMDSNIITILGNHEAYLLGILECSEERWVAYNLDYVKRRIDLQTLYWLKRLPRDFSMTFDGLNIAFFHGSPWSPLEEYVYPDCTSLSRFSQVPYDYVFLGHTHYQMIKSLGSTTIVNPGSCGLPRDGDYRSGAAIFHIGSDIRIELLRLEYDVGSFINFAKSNNVNSDALERLKLGVE